MKIPRGAMTPELDAAIETFIGDGAWFRIPAPGAGEAGASEKRRAGDPDRARTLLRRHAELESSLGYGTLFTVLSAALIGLFLLAGESLALTAVPAILAIGTAALAYRLRARRPDGPRPTVEFLTAILPRLYLRPVQRRYAEGVLAVHGGKVRDPNGEGLALLRRLMEEERRLDALGLTVEVPPSDAVGAEAEDLRARFAAAQDPTAREALAQGISLAERRFAAAERAGGVRERLDAHRLLLDQASQAALEGLLGWGDLATSLDDLRANVASLAHEAEALETAVEEMRSL